jgi:hypothetical protein
MALIGVPTAISRRYYLAKKRSARSTILSAILAGKMLDLPFADRQRFKVFRPGKLRVSFTQAYRLCKNCLSYRAIKEIAISEAKVSLVMAQSNRI